MDPVFAIPSLHLDHWLTRCGSSMVRGFGILFHVLGLNFILQRLRLEEHSVERLRQAAARGPVVYLLYRRSILDGLGLNRALNVRNLPLATYMDGLWTTPFRPLGEAIVAMRDQLRDGWREGRLPNFFASGVLKGLLRSGGHACLFLTERARWLPNRTEDPAFDVVESLLQAQAEVERPIQIVPVVVVWDRSPPAARSEIWRLVLGDDAWPTGFAKIRLALTRGREAIIQVGEPVDVAQFLAHTEKQAASRRSRVLRMALRRYLYREQSVVRGPRIRSRRWMQRLVLESQTIRDLVREEVASTGQTKDRVQKRVEKTFDRIAARLSFTMVLLAREFTRFLWNRIYGGVVIREEDLERVRTAARRGTPVLVPCHRSHLDYVLVSSTFYEHDVAIPHVVAGINLSFWPLGAVLRRLGAVFVKRSFKGDRVFAVVFARYLQQLIREGYPVEFFIEGGRSRTGKVLSPKVGVLGMILEAAARIRTKDFEVTFLPMNISYEQVAEEASYAREVQGEGKRTESIGELMKAPRVLAHRYGKVYLRVGEPIPAGEVLDALEGPWETLSEERRKFVLHQLGCRLLHRVNVETVVQPTGLVAAAMLCHGRRGIRRDALLARVERFRTFLERRGASMSTVFDRPSQAVDQAIQRFLEGRKIGLYEDEVGPVYRLPEEQRVALEYYKNMVLHFFVPASLLALAVRRGIRVGSDARANEAGTIDLVEPSRVLHVLARMFREEFILDPDLSPGQLEEKALADLVDLGALEPAVDEAGGGWQVADPARLAEIAALTVNFVESYLVVLKAIRSIRSPTMDAAALPAAVLRVARGLYAVEEIRWPEAISVPNLRNAVRVFTDDGMIRYTPGSGLHLEESGWTEYRRLLEALCA